MATWKRRAGSALFRLRGQLQRLAHDGPDRIGHDANGALRWDAARILPAREPGEHRRPQPRGDGTRVVEASDDQHEEGAVAAAAGPAVGTAGQMMIDGRGLFRRKLAIQIFPQSFDDLGTLHSHILHQGAGRLGRGHALVNSAPPPEVPPA